MLERVESQMVAWVDELENKTIKELFSLLPKGKRLRAKLVLKVAGSRIQS